MVLKITQNFYNKRDQTKPEPFHLLVAEQMGDLIKDGVTVKYAILCKKMKLFCEFAQRVVSLRGKSPFFRVSIFRKVVHTAL